MLHMLVLTSHDLPWCHLLRTEDLFVLLLPRIKHKTNNKQLLFEAEVKERGDHVCAVTEKDGVKLIAAGWEDSKRKLLLSSHGNTLPGDLHVKNDGNCLRTAKNASMKK